MHDDALTNQTGTTLTDTMLGNHLSIVPHLLQSLVSGLQSLASPVSSLQSAVSISGTLAHSPVCPAHHHAPCCLCSGPPWLVHASNTGLGLSLLRCLAPTKGSSKLHCDWPHMRPASANLLAPSPLLLCRCVCCCPSRCSVWLLLTRCASVLFHFGHRHYFLTP